MRELDDPSNDLGRLELARDRTKWAEDRTVLANERTFGGWARTALGALGVALGFQAIFRSTEPVWLAQAGASVFVILAVIIFWTAYFSARKVLSRLDSHEGSRTSGRRLLFVTTSATVGSLTLLFALWLF